MAVRFGVAAYVALTLALILLVTGVGFTVGPTPTNPAPIAITVAPPSVDSSTWGKWRVYYRTASSIQIKMADAARKRLIGPVQFYNIDNARTKERLRARRSTTWECPQFGAGWRCYWLNLQRDGPGWSPWGMAGLVQVRWKNGVIREVTGTKDCWHWSTFVTVNEKDCTVYLETAGIDMATFRIKYTVEWHYLIGNTVVSSAGSWSANGNGWLGGQTWT